MHSLKRLICFLSLLFASVHCESYISKPGPGAETGDHEDNPTYKEGNDINFKWRTNITNVKLMLWQTWPNPGGGQAYYYNLLGEFLTPCTSGCCTSVNRSCREWRGDYRVHMDRQLEPLRFGLPGY